MKKLIYGGLFLASVGITFVSCRKTEPTPNAVDSTKIENADVYGTPKSGFDGEFQLGNEGRFLVFNNENGYAHAVDNPSDEVRQNLFSRMTNLNHNSWKDYVDSNPNQGLDTLIKDEYFASILSDEKTVQIGQHIYKLNPENEKVYAIHVKDKKHYNELLSNNENSAFVRTFNFSDNVLEAIKVGGGDPTPPAIFCNEGGVGSQQNIAGYNDYPNHSFYIQLNYLRYGIYFPLKIYVKNNLGSKERLYIQVENLWYHVRCGSTVGPYSHPWLAPSSSSYDSRTYTSYSGMTALNGFHIKARARYEDWSQPSGGNPYTIYFSTWAHIMVNNPTFPW